MLSETKSAPASPSGGSGGFDIISIGAATVDIFVKSDQFILDHDLIALKHSSKNEITQSLISSGGGATNSSVAFSRLGLQPACLALFGSDPLGQYVLKDLHNIDLLLPPQDETTDYSVILVAPDGGRSILTQRGPSRLEEKHLDFDKLQSKWLYITSLEGNLELLEKLIGYAVENNIKIALNPGNRELAHTKRLLPLLSHLDFLLLNKTESQFFTESQLKIPHITAVTYGREGAYIYTQGQKLFSPCLNATPVDETGAGDAFGSAFVAALAHKLTPEEALFWGVKNSASVVSALGAKPGLLTLSKIEN